MSSSEESKSSDNEEEFEPYWKLDTIPPELFLHICSFLRAKYVINVLSQVSRRFRDIIQDDVTWKTRIGERWPRLYPIIKGDDNFDWKKACIEREEHYHMWHNNAVNMKKYHISGAHLSTVDVVLIVEKGHICASGSRDRGIKLWDLCLLNQLPDQASNCGTDYSISQSDSKLDAHTGWIWSMAYTEFDQTLYTGSWDGSAKSWDLNNLIQEKNTFKFRSPVLCLAFSENILACGRYDKKVSLIDSRSSNQPFFQHTHHRKCVLCMVADEKFIITGSEDNTVVVFNRIAGKVQNILQFEGFPMSLSYGHGQLWVGDKLGLIHIVDPTHEKFDIVKSYPSGHKSRVNGITHSLGSIITCSADKSIHVLEPNADPHIIASLPTNSEVAGISNYKSTLVSANSDSSLSVWMPANNGSQ